MIELILWGQQFWNFLDSELLNLSPVELPNIRMLDLEMHEMNKG